MNRPYRPYIPSHFGTSDSAAKALIAAHPFATLITVHGGQVYATQIPFVFRGDNTLIAHMAHANPHSVALLGQVDGAAIHATVQFTGVNGYISPAWYGVNTGVPTWNYQSVQVQGVLNVLYGAPVTEAVVKALIDAFDPQAEVVKQAWADLPAAAQEAQLGAIVAFEIEISSIDGKSKLSQNRSAADRQRVIAALAVGSANGLHMASTMGKASIT